MSKIDKTTRLVLALFAQSAVWPCARGCFRGHTREFNDQNSRQMSSLLMLFCCCKTGENDDEQYLITNHDQDEADSRPQTQV